jgi:hypothetical protein
MKLGGSPTGLCNMEQSRNLRKSSVLYNRTQRSLPLNDCRAPVESTEAEMSYAAACLDKGIYGVQILPAPGALRCHNE